MIFRVFLSAIFALLTPFALMADIIGAKYVTPTNKYGHGVVPNHEFAGLEVNLSPDRILGVGTYDTVYEDTKPRLVDIDNDGLPEIITIISYFDKGAAIRVWKEIQNADHPKGSSITVIAETKPIGQPHRWLAIAGIADFNGDGDIDIAYVDRPHLAKTLRIVSYRDGKLIEIANAKGHTNHKIGWDFIPKGVRDCGDGPEIITASGGWDDVLATRVNGQKLQTRKIGEYKNLDSLKLAINCH